MDLVAVESVRVARERADLRLAPGEVPLAGGTWLFSEPQPGTTGLVDLAGMGWPALTELADGGLSIAATCPIGALHEMPSAGLAHSSAVADLFSACADALLMSWKIQNVATVGGNLCMALPAGAMISLTAALDGVAVIWTPDDGERREPVAEFVHGVQSTSLAPGEVLRAVELPGAALTARVAMRRISLAHLGRSAALVIGRRDADGGFVATVSAATTRPHVLRFTTLPDRAALASAVDAIDDWYDDVHGAPDWRHAMTRRFAAELREELA
jgi:CO/xanthine dehydrogenase FAD-binding subunit